MRRGSSGASIIEVPRVIKEGNERVAIQGHWLMQHPYDILPRVYEVNETSYTMERLVDPPYEMLDHRVLLNHTYDALRELWFRPPVVRLDPASHQGKLLSLHTRIDRTSAFTQLNALRGNITWPSLGVGLTHGDPTLDNVMLRGSQVVLIDPIPATPAVPDLHSVDTGKLLQSILGYEVLRYADDTYRWRLTTDHLWKQYIPNENEWLATVYWCVVHLLRAIPYMPNEDVVAGLWGMIKNALDLV